MVCPRCGTELAEGCVYCPKCGQEVQVISAVDDLEEEILRGFMEEDQSSEISRETAPSSTVAKAKQKRKKKRTRNLIIVFAVIAAALVAFGVFRYHQNHSVDHLLRRAQEEYVQRDYDRAMNYLDKLLALDGENEEGLLLAGQVYEAMQDYDYAENMFFQVIDIDPDSVPAYEGLLEALAAQGKTDEILALKKTVTNSEILALFDQYLTPEPEIKVEGGTFGDSLTVEIRATKKGLSIYYTLDGTVPTAEDTLYESPVEIDQEGTTVLTAICVDEDGDYSEPVSETYVIQFSTPDMPKASPDGGQFSYPATITVTVPAGTTVYYTWDNTTPGPDSYCYTEPIQIPEGNNVLSLVAIDENGKASNVLKCNYIYYPETTSQSIPDTPTTYSDTGGNDQTQYASSDTESETGYETDYDPQYETGDTDGQNETEDTSQQE